MGWNVIEIWECELKLAFVTETLDNLPKRIVTNA